MVGREQSYRCKDPSALRELVLGMPSENNDRLSTMLRMRIPSKNPRSIIIEANGGIYCILTVNYWNHGLSEPIEGGELSIARFNRTPVDALDFAFGRKPYLVDFSGAERNNIPRLKRNLEIYTGEGYDVIAATLRINPDPMYNSEETRLELRNGLIVVSGKPNKKLTTFIKGVI